MANPEFLKREEEDVVLPLPIFGAEKGEGVNLRALSLEKKIDFLESLASKVSNRRSRRWLNDRLLIELVPRLNAEEIRGLFAPPPWGDNVPLSPFCMTNVREWDKYRSIDMDREATMIEALSSTKRKEHVQTDRMAALNAWKRIDCRTREALRRNFLPDMVKGFEECVRAFIMESGDGDVLVLHVQNPFHRLLLHGVCEFYDLVSVTVNGSKDSKPLKMMRIKKKKAGCPEIPNMTLTHFLKSAKEGAVKSS